MYTLKAKLKTDFWFWKLHKDLGTLGEGLNPKKKKKCEFSHKGGCTNLGHFHTQMSLSPSVCLSAKPLYSFKSSSFIIQHSSCNSRLMHSFFGTPVETTVFRQLSSFEEGWSSEVFWTHMSHFSTPKLLTAVDPVKTLTIWTWLKRDHSCFLHFKIHY